MADTKPPETDQTDQTDQTAPEAPPAPSRAEVESNQTGAVFDVPVEISAVLGTAQIQVSQLLKMGRGAVLELDRKIGDPIDIYVNKRKVARGDVVVVDERLAVTLTETIKSRDQP